MNTDNMKPYLRLFRTFISVAVIVFLASSCASVQLNQKNWAEKIGQKNWAKNWAEKIGEKVG